MKMRVEGAQLIDWLRASDLEPRSYSGRAMYGARCVGVTVRPVESLAIGARLACAAVNELSGDESDDVRHEDVMDTLDSVADLMGDAREDSMGRDVIVYWPDVEWPADAEEHDDDDDEG